MSLIVRPFCPADRAAWEILARGYKDFYKSPTTDAGYTTAWERLLTQEEICGLGAFADDQMVGIAHYFFHTSVWGQKICYLQDLFTSSEARRQGAGRCLIEAVAAHARLQGASRYFWHTHEQNQVARSLYDRVATYAGFIRYEYQIRTPGA